MNKKISVIVPVYNRLEHLRALCQCLIKQEEKPYELIISDDGSSEKIIDFIIQFNIDFFISQSLIFFIL
ncbi:glycosyltransferase [Fusobacterium mortiferum]|uniref:glycosyltransferase n=1 Tax=Fusobacterium mortiferum TaxID=850 RepID=UPI00195E5497|nr:glycosyltransferase [Fusobacterium mortiferum]